MSESEKKSEEKSVACFGSGDGLPGEPMYDAMEEVGRILAVEGITILTGGFGGAGMEAAPRGARKAGGKSVGYTLLGKPGNPYLTEVVDCHKFAEGIPFFADFGIRLCGLMQADGFIIAAGGGAGTAIELLTAVQFNKEIFGKFVPGPEKRCIAILKPAGVDVPGWYNKMLSSLQEWGLLDEANRNLIRVVSAPEDAVSWVLRGYIDDEGSC
ncbi:MAG: LOG family protein [bacterium]|nr:LOG family protein [bacterium]